MIAGPAAVFLLVSSSFLLGWLLILTFARHWGPVKSDWLALFFACLTLGVAVIGWLALVLAELGWFSLNLLVALWLLAVLVLAILAGRGRASPGESSASFQVLGPSKGFSGLPAWPQYAFLGLWLVAASWLFFRPHEYVTGAADAGVYVNLAASINDSGGIIIEDPLLAEVEPALYPSLLRVLPPQEAASRVAPYYILPGFYVTGSPPGRITPQFYPLHAVWQAIAFGLGGVRAALMMTGLWAALGCLAIYLVMRRIAGWEAAILVLSGLTINALQVWFARYPTTEALTQYLLWSAVWCLMKWIQDERPAPLWGLVAGLALGELFLVRIDTYFLLAIPIGLWFWLRWGGRWRRDHWWFFLPLALLTAHSIIHALWLSRPYFFGIFGYGLDLLRRNGWLPAAALFFGLFLLFTFGRYKGRFVYLNRFRRPILWAIVALIVGLAAYGWFVRPHIGLVEGSSEYWYGGEQIPAGLNQENLIRLGWYLSPLGIALAVTGICLMVLEIDRQKALILAVGLFFSFLYLWRIQANPYQIYAMRRYVPAVMPLAMIGASYLFGWFFRQKRAWLRLGGFILALIWLAGLIRSGQGFIFQVDHEGLIAQFDALDHKIAEGSILIFNDQSTITIGDYFGTPLRFLYGHDVFSLRDREGLDPGALRAVLDRWQAKGRQIYWIGDPGLLAELGLSGTEPLKVTIESQYLEAPYDRKPEALESPKWELSLTPLE